MNISSSTFNRMSVNFASVPVQGIDPVLSRLCNPSERADLGSCTQQDIILLGHLHRELDDDWAWGWA